MKVNLPFKVENDQQAWLIDQIMTSEDQNYWFDKCCNKESEQPKEWKEFSSKVIEKVISSRDLPYTETIKVLVNAGYLLQERSWSTAFEKAMNYKINPIFINNEIIPHFLTTKKIFKNYEDKKTKDLTWLRTMATETDRLENKNNKVIWDNLKKLDDKELKIWLEIKSKDDWYFKPTQNTTKPIRVHHPLVNLPSNLKNLIRINGEEVERLDLVSAWPNLSVYIYSAGPGGQCSVTQTSGNNNTSEIQKENENKTLTYQENGEILNLMMLLPKKPASWKMKDKTFKKLRSGYYCNPNPNKRNLFQREIEKIPELKDYNNWVIKNRSNKRNPLWKQLEEFESYLMRRCLYPEFVKAGIPWISEHDGCAVPKSKIEQAKKIFDEVLMNETGGFIKGEIKK